MARFAALYGAIQLAGGAYLIRLGLSPWREGAPAAADRPATDGAAPARLHRAALKGLSLTLGNPKVGVFFGSIFVTLLPAETPLWVRAAALGIVAGQETTWYVLVACLFSQPRIRAGYAQIRTVLDRAIGTVFITLGARIAALAHV